MLVGGREQQLHQAVDRQEPLGGRVDCVQQIP